MLQTRPRNLLGVGLRAIPDQLAVLIDELRATDGLTAKGKLLSTFYIGSKPFLHFHDGPDGLGADVKFTGDFFERVPVDTPAQQAQLLQAVRAHLQHSTG